MEIPQSLRQNITAKCIIPFVGSGASLAIKDAYYPSWPQVIGEFVNTLRKEAKKTDADLVEALAANRDYLEATDKARSALGLHLYRSELSRLFDKPLPAGANTAIHQSVWNLSPRTVLTLNYDNLLSQTNTTAVKVTNDETSKLGRIFSNQQTGNQQFVWHLHGDIQRPDSIVLCKTEYDRLYRADSAAIATLKPLIANFPFLFIGFGFQDPEVLELLSSVFQLFHDAPPNSFALIRKGDDESRRLWQQYKIQPIEFENYGGPLEALMRELSQTSATIATSSNQHDTLTVTNRVASPVIPNSAKDAIALLRNKFSFIWEPESISYQNLVLYWPVRLREPTAIHAMQAFAASYLMKFGCKIALCLDDYGHDTPHKDRFVQRIERWMRTTVADDKFAVYSFKELLADDSKKSYAWGSISDWLGNKGGNLADVLRITKIQKTQNANVDLNHPGTGRFLRPAAVWSCLSAICESYNNHSVITFGGHDERELWKKWRELSQSPSSVEHLYVPELSHVHMDTTNLAWKSLEDIISTIRSYHSKSHVDWRSQNSIVLWTLHGCIELPELVFTDRVTSKTYYDSAQTHEQWTQIVASEAHRWLHDG